MKEKTDGEESKEIETDPFGENQKRTPEEERTQQLRRFESLECADEKSLLRVLKRSKTSTDIMKKVKAWAIPYPLLFSEPFLSSMEAYLQSQEAECENIQLAASRYIMDNLAKIKVNGQQIKSSNTETQNNSSENIVITKKELDKHEEETVTAPIKQFPGNPIESEKVENNRKQCHVCGAYLRENAKFCPSCGAETGRMFPQKVSYCRMCGTRIEENAAFCKKCGTRIAGVITPTYEDGNRQIDATSVVKTSVGLTTESKFELSCENNNEGLKVTPKEIPSKELDFSAILEGTSAKLRRAFILAEDGEWSKANEYFESILDEEPENAYAYIGKLLVEMRINNVDQLRSNHEAIMQSRNYKRAIRYAESDIKDFLRSLTYEEEGDKE